MSKTQVYHIELEDESDYSVTFSYLDPCTCLPIDLTNYTAEMQVRQRYNGYDTPDIALEFNTNTGGGIVLGGTAGTVVLTISNTITIGNTWTDGVYDLFLISPTGLRTKLVKGFFTIIQSVTRAEQSSL